MGKNLREETRREKVFDRHIDASNKEHLAQRNDIKLCKQKRKASNDKQPNRAKVAPILTLVQILPGSSVAMKAAAPLLEPAAMSSRG